MSITEDKKPVESKSQEELENRWQTDEKIRQHHDLVRRETFYEVRTS